MATIEIPTPLRKFTDRNRTYDTQKQDLQEALNELVDTYPGLKENLFTEDGTLRSYVKIYVDDEEIDGLENGSGKIDEDSTISIIPAIAGGC